MSLPPSFPAVEANLSEASTESTLRVRVKAESAEEVVGAVAGQPLADPRSDSPRVVAPPSKVLDASI